MLWCATETRAMSRPPCDAGPALFDGRTRRRWHEVWAAKPTRQQPQYAASGPGPVGDDRGGGRDRELSGRRAQQRAAAPTALGYRVRRALRNAFFRLPGPAGVPTSRADGVDGRPPAVFARRCRGAAGCGPLSGGVFSGRGCRGASQRRERAAAVGLRGGADPRAGANRIGRRAGATDAGGRARMPGAPHAVRGPSAILRFVSPGPCLRGMYGDARLAAHGRAGVPTVGFGRARRGLPPVRECADS